MVSTQMVALVTMSMLGIGISLIVLVLSMAYYRRKQPETPENMIAIVATIVLVSGMLLVQFGPPVQTRIGLVAYFLAWFLSAFAVLYFFGGILWVNRLMGKGQSN